MPWLKRTKIDTFSMCLRKEASEYFSILSAKVRNNFDEIKTNLNLTSRKLMSQVQLDVNYRQWSKGKINPWKGF